MKKEYKCIADDSITREFLACLKVMRMKAGLSQKGLADMLNIRKNDVQCYELGRNSPSLSVLMRLAEFFKYDLSESVNYKFFHQTIKPSSLKRELKRFGLSYTEIGKLAGYDRQQIFETVNYRKYASVGCMAAILEILKHERMSSRLREKFERRRRE